MSGGGHIPRHHLTAADYLAVGFSRYVEVTDACMPIWSRRMSAGKSGLGREVVIELTRDLVFRVRDPQTGQVLAESMPGKPGALNVHAR